MRNASRPPEGSVIYSGPGLFSEGAQRNCHSLNSFLCDPHLEEVGEGRVEFVGLWVNISSRCAVLNINNVIIPASVSAARFFSFTSNLTCVCVV